MPRVEIPGVGIVNFPDNMPRDEIMTRAEAMQSKSQTPLFDPKDLPTSQLIKGGFSRGIEGIKGTAFDLLPALAGSMIGQKDYAKEQLAEYRDRMAAEEAISPTAYKGIKDIQGIGDFGGFVAETAGELVPDIASFLLGAGAGTVAGKAIAKKSAATALKEGMPAHVAKRQLAEEAATKLEQRVLSSAAAQGASIGSTVGLFGTSMGQSIPETLNSIYEETQDLAPGLAITFGSLKGALDTYLPSKILKQLGPAGKDRVAAAMLEKSTVVPANWKKAFVGEALKTTAGEGLTESAQQAIDILAGQVAGGKDPFFSEKNIDNILFAGLKGAVGGGTFGAPGAAMEASRIKQASQQEIARREMVQQQEAEKQRQEQEQKAQEELTRQQTATGDLFGQEVPQGPGIPSTTVAERELAAATPKQNEILDLIAAFKNTDSPVAKEAIGKELLRLQAEGKLAETSYEKQMLLDFLGPMLGYNPNIPSSRTATADNAPITVNQQGVAVTPDQRALGELVKYSQEESRFNQAATPVKETDLQDTQDMFAAEKGIMESEQLAGIPNQPPSVESALAGPPVAPAEFKTKLDAPSLQGTGLRPQSGFFKKLLNKDLADPADQAAVRDILVQVRQNPNIADSTKQAIESLAMQAFAALGQQANMVGPRGGIRRDINYGRIQPRPPATEADRTSVQVPEQQVPELAEGVGAPEQSGMAPAGSVTSGLGDGTNVQPSTLAEGAPSETTQTVKPERKAKATKPAVPAPVAEQVAEEVAPTAPKVEESREDQIAYLRFLEDALEGTVDPAEIRALTKEIVDLKAKLGRNKGKAQRTNKLTDALRNWASGSAAVDENGEPLTLYHGTSVPPVKKGAIEKDFDQFKLSPSGALGAGIYMAPETEFANQYANTADGRVIPVIVKITNPLVIKTTKGPTGQSDPMVSALVTLGVDRAKAESIVEKAYEEKGYITREVMSRAQKQGYDGIFQYMNGELAEVVAFSPSQIKSIFNENPEIGGARFKAGEGAGKFTGDVSKLAKDLRAALDKMGLSKVAVNLDKELFDANGNPVQGFYQNKLIQVALSANDPGFTLDHEALHAMRELGFFSPNDWGILSNMARNTWMKQYGIEAKYPDLDKEGQIEEAVAEAFAAFQQQPPNVQSLMAKVLNTLRRIGNFISGYGFKAPDDILGKAASGQLAKDRADVIEKFNDYLDTTPNGEVKYQVAAQREVFTGMNKVIRNSPIGNDAQKAAVAEGIKRAGEAAKSGILALMPMHALGEIADGVFPGLGTRFNRLINERAGYQDTLNRGTDAVVEEAKQAIKSNPEQRDAFNRIVNESTVNEVDPTKARSEYLKDPEKLAAYDKLVKEYNSLKQPWKNLYVTMRDGYKQMYEEVKKSITTRIDETDLDPATKKSVKESVLAKLAEKGMIEPYFGLGREGQYWLAADYKDKAGQQQYTVEAFKSDYERKTRIEQLQQMGASRIEPYANIAEINYRRAPTGSFVNSVLNIMETNKVDQKAIDEMMRLFLTTLPETAFAQSFQKRKGTAGFMEDSIGVFERKMRNTSHQVANMVYNPKLTGVVDNMRERTVEVGKGTDKESARDNQVEKAYLGEFEKHLSYVLAPTKNDIGSILTSAAFTYTLGFNLSSAIVNMANVPMIVAPYLKGKYADSSVARAIGDASKLFTGSGTKTNTPVIGADGRTTGMRVMPSITNYAPDSEMGKRYATLIRIGNEQGQFNRSQLYEIISGDTRTGVMAKFNAMSGWMFHHGERMNREVTMVATYNLELDRLMKDKPRGLNEADSKAFDTQAETQAANTAIYTTELTNGGISAASAPRIAQNPIGKMFFMYKRYGISMYYMMFKTAKEALKGETAEVRAAAFRQLGGIVGMSALMAGAQGIPMFGALSLVYSLFTDEDEDDLDAVTQKALGDFLYKGPVEYATNLAIAGRITLNDLIIRDAPKGSATTFSQQLAQALGGPVVGVADRIQRGYSKLNEGNVSRAMEDLLPSAIANGFKAYRYATEGTKTLRGDPITGEVSLYNSVAQALGFAPADYTRQLEINSREKGIDKVLSQQEHKQKQKYYSAKREGDIDGMNDAREKLLEMGAKHPGLEITPATINDVLKRSGKAQDRATKEMMNGVRYNKKRIKEVQASLAEYED
jgi:hypothetical protein